jgi:hypothetical protein
MYLNFGKNVLYATKERVQNHWRFKEIDDRGVLSTTENGVRFKGKRHDFQISEIQGVSKAKESPNFALAVTGPLIWFVAYFAAGLLFRLLFEGLGASLLNIDRTDILCVVIGSVVTVVRAILRLESWICVEYKEAGARGRKAFFRRLPFRNPQVLHDQMGKLIAVKE